MVKTAIIVDSTAYLNQEIATLPNVFQVDLSIIFDDGKTFKDMANIDEQAQFYKYMEQSKQLPKSSQPHPGEYYKLMDEIVEQGFQSVIAIHLSSSISGTYAMAKSILSEYQDRIEGHAVDSKSSCIVIEGLTRIALKGLEDQKSIQEIVTEITWQANHTQVYFMVEDLDNLVKGGRLNPRLATLGQLLKIRPVLHFNEEGGIVLFEKIRTNKKVYARWIQLIQEAMATYPQGVHVMMTHADTIEEASMVASLIKSELGISCIHTNSIGPVIGTHTGKDCIGLAIIPNYGENKVNNY
ncbi:DegV family protein [Facklamia miroungae]|uniref:EDD domain protein, DegV family n=1 Tax=Facklamia miroungae TaxID=120956 RepID=A0A1G7SH71_9LACT|nr:DegV family protein [Facklamia miroungae]NKZ29654.1 DegV family protein [Facklamia miroungae]SDG22291.1 EDD domain protein, DegV family [Facklamia miroungae]